MIVKRIDRKLRLGGKLKNVKPLTVKRNFIHREPRTIGFVAKTDEMVSHKETGANSRKRTETYVEDNLDTPTT